MTDFHNDPAYRARVWSEESAAITYELITVSHPSWSVPLRFVASAEPGFVFVSRGQSWVGAPVSVVWPGSDPARPMEGASLGLVITVPDHAGVASPLTLMRAAVAAGEARATLRIELVEAALPDVLRESTPELEVLDLDWDAASGAMQVQIGPPSFAMRRAGRRFVPAVYPSLAGAVQ
jgi:hypothetical protein